MNKIQVYHSSDTNILVWDMLVSVLVLTLALSQFTALHTAFCLLIAIGITVVIVAVWHTRVGFWLVSAVFSAFWGGLAYGITALFTEDAIWQWMVFGLAVLVALGSHLLARRYTQNIEEV
ncbi:Uncharacterised protein [Anaerotruncus sp. 2789STDY5834896]|uniref:Uncharacterized protein n=1 Tax=uncultured Anaerotruncus sp. TaxID=905011 RepID=A0A1C6JVM1_9FIRM|nr:Uncharacterised protein [uncultured Anaerotruncus sp.]